MLIKILFILMIKCVLFGKFKDTSSSIYILYFFLPYARQHTCTYFLIKFKPRHIIILGIG